MPVLALGHCRWQLCGRKLLAATAHHRTHWAPLADLRAEDATRASAFIAGSEKICGCANNNSGSLKVFDLWSNCAGSVSRRHWTQTRVGPQEAVSGCGQTLIGTSFRLSAERPHPSRLLYSGGLRRFCNSRRHHVSSARFLAVRLELLDCR